MLRSVYHSPLVSAGLGPAVGTASAGPRDPLPVMFCSSAGVDAYPSLHKLQPKDARLTGSGLSTFLKEKKLAAFILLNNICNFRSFRGF